MSKSGRPSIDMHREASTCKLIAVYRTMRPAGCLWTRNILSTELKRMGLERKESHLQSVQSNISASMTRKSLRQRCMKIWLLSRDTKTSMLLPLNAYNKEKLSLKILILRPQQQCLQGLLKSGQPSKRLSWAMLKISKKKSRQKKQYKTSLLSSMKRRKTRFSNNSLL